MESRKDWKTLQFNYDDLIDTPEHSCMYCLTDRQVKMILAQTEYIGWTTRYFSNNQNVIDQDKIDAWRAELEDALMGNGCFEELNTQQYFTQQRQNKLINQQRAEQYTGTPGSINSNAPGDNFNGDNSQARNDALCSASKDYVRSRVLETLNLYRLQLTGASIAAGIAGWFGGVFGLIGGGIAVLIAAMQLAEVELAAADNAQLDAVTCELYNTLKGTAINPANFNTKIQALNNGTGTHSTIVRIVKSTSSRMENYLLFVDLLGEWYTRALAGAQDCPCNTEWCKEWDFTVSNGLWTAGGVDATYVAGQGWKTGVNQGLIQIKRTMSLSQVKSVRVILSSAAAAGGSGLRAPMPNMNSATGSIDYTFNLNYSGVELNVAFDSNFSGGSNPVYNGYIRKVVVRGNGVNPFGADDCT